MGGWPSTTYPTGCISTVRGRGRGREGECRMQNAHRMESFHRGCYQLVGRKGAGRRTDDCGSQAASVRIATPIHPLSLYPCQVLPKLIPRAEAVWRAKRASAPPPGHGLELGSIQRWYGCCTVPVPRQPLDPYMSTGIHPPSLPVQLCSPSIHMYLYPKGKAEERRRCSSTPPRVPVSTYLHTVAVSSSLRPGLPPFLHRRPSRSVAFFPPSSSGRQHNFPLPPHPSPQSIPNPPPPTNAHRQPELKPRCRMPASKPTRASARLE